MTIASMGSLKRVACLCPTYRRPKLLANAIACFERQTYPNRRLIVFDDAGELKPARGDRWEIVTTVNRTPTLPGKFNLLAQMAGPADVYAVFEDDDIYLPHHIEAHVESLTRTGAMVSLPRRGWSLYTGNIEQESRIFHASIAFRREAFDQVDGWTETPRDGFDYLMMDKLAKLPCVDLTERWPPGYVFRWGSTGAYHGQAYMTGDDGKAGGWYDRMPGRTERQGDNMTITPELDAESREVLERMSCLRRSS